MMMKRTTEQITDSSRGNTVPSWDRTVPFKIGTLITVDNAHSTGDTKYSVFLVAKIAVIAQHRRNSIRN